MMLLRKALAVLAAFALIPLLGGVARSAGVVSPSYLNRVNTTLAASYSSGEVITREDFCAITARMFYGDEPIGRAILPFEDTDKISTDAIPYIQYLYSKKIISGSLDYGKLYMNPDLPVTREDALVILSGILSRKAAARADFADADTISVYACPAVAWFADRGIITARTDGTFGPKESITAEEAAALIIKSLDYHALNKTALRTYFGVGSKGFQNGNAALAGFFMPTSTVYSARGLYVFDTGNNMIRLIKDGEATTAAGAITGWDDYNMPVGGHINGSAKDARLDKPASGVIGTNGTLYFCDTGNSAIRTLSSGGSMAGTLAGGEAGHRDGFLKDALFNGPAAIAVDSKNNIYVADTLNDCIRLISGGKATTVTGIPGMEGYTNGIVRRAAFNAPSGIAVTPDGKIIYVADTGNHCIRKIENGFVTTIAGAVAGYDADGTPIGGYRDGATREAWFNLPMGITLADGLIIVADSGNNRIRAITPDGFVITIAGNGDPGDADGPALDAGLSGPSGVTYADGKLYITDTYNNKIKVMDFDAETYKCTGGL